jgi:hypothetical protein
MAKNRTFKANVKVRTLKAVAKTKAWTIEGKEQIRVL